MKRRTLGRTGLEVTQLGFGAMEVRGPKVWGGREVGEEQADRVLNAVLDAGINFIDTAVDYGLSEERIGKYISSRRGEFYLATKCGCDPKDLGDRWETPHTWTRENLRRNIAGSLERMKTDHVDILQLHNPTPDQVRDGGLVDVLKDIQSQHLTRFIGISSTLPHLPRFVEMGVFDTFQVPYSCLQPEHHDAITLAGEAGAGVIVRGGIAKGGPESDVAVAERVGLWERAGLAELLGDMTPAELILLHTLSHPHCHTTIVGTLSVEHLAENTAAANKGPLPADLYQEVRRRVAKSVEA
ncbi:MAG TPA: aldo/keto reductase [Phycisphaerae bacterium]|nr:aldo/keto reductase [Phycisphaerae bacterium]